MIRQACSWTTIALLLLVSSVLGCGGRRPDQQQPAETSSAEPSENGISTETPLPVAVLLAPSGKGDRSYNDMVLGGLTEYEESGKIDLREIQPAEVADYPNVLQAAGSDYPLVIAVGFLYAEPLAKVALELGDTHFLLLDGVAGDLPNVRSVTFRPEEGSFVAGAVAAAASDAGEVGFIGGMDIPIIRRFYCGFKHGVDFFNSMHDGKVSVLSQYIGTTPAAFSNPSQGRDLARLMYSRGADIIFHAAGKSGNGVIQAAVSMDRRVIGVDTDQSHLAPNTVLTSMRKRLDRAAARAVADQLAGRFSGGVEDLGWRDGGVDVVLNPAKGQSLSPRLTTIVQEAASELPGAVAHCKNG